MKKKDRDRLIALAGRHPEYALGYQDETWWSRVTQPSMHAWAEEGQALRLIEQVVPKDDPDPKALACYGLLVSCPGAPDTLSEQVWLRFVDGHPISDIIIQYLAWCCEKLASPQENLAHDLGQCLLAHQQVRAPLDSAAQSRGAPQRQRRAHRALLLADQESMAQPH